LRNGRQSLLAEAGGDLALTSLLALRIERSSSVSRDLHGVLSHLSFDVRNEKLGVLSWPVYVTEYGEWRKYEREEDVEGRVG
jgi:hypothetical protein